MTIASKQTCWRASHMLGLLIAAALPTAAAEKRFDFSDVAEGQPPPGFRSVVSGTGSPGDWRIIQSEVTPAQGSGDASPVRKSVLAQVSTDPEDERFPMLVYEGEVFTDFKLTTRFKTVEGRKERMAGIAFRVQNETNYYVLRASSLGNTFRFYKVVDGQRGAIIGPEISIPSGVWHEMAIECRGNELRCFLNGKEAIPAMSDSSFIRGKIAFWTKSDSVSYFTDTRITYIRTELPAKRIVEEVSKDYGRLIDLQLFVSGTNGSGSPRLLASKLPPSENVDTATEAKVMSTGKTYYGKTKKNVSVVMPLRDRNGDVLGVVRVVMETFRGQTEDNAIVRAAPVVKSIQRQVSSIEDLVLME